MPATAGLSPYTVNTAQGCQWTSLPAGIWLDAGAGTGTQTVNLSAAARSGTLARTGSIDTAGSLLQVAQDSPNPSQPFTDVPLGHPFFSYIAILRDRAVTLGCGPSIYCPDSSTTRGEMAAFLIRALLRSDAFSYPVTPYFTDVPSTHGFFKYIQKMRELGITSGCTATTYCPGDTVTRGQMAVFIIRSALGLTPADTVAFPAAPFFDDVPAGHPFFANIQKMKQRAITSGCSTTSYCPDDPVTRGQMAVFVVRGLLTP
jgi:hypothetical protein